MTSEIHSLQNTCAQRVITGRVSDSKQTAHSSSEPELRTNFILLTKVSCSSSGVLLPANMERYLKTEISTQETLWADKMQLGQFIHNEDIAYSV